VKSLDSEEGREGHGQNFRIEHEDVAPSIKDDAERRAAAEVVQAPVSADLGREPDRAAEAIQIDAQALIAAGALQPFIVGE
jgi:hypothetical protein